MMICRCVGMADEGDSKSLVLTPRVGSTPTTGIKAPNISYLCGMLGAYLFALIFVKLNFTTIGCYTKRDFGVSQKGIPFMKKKIAMGCNSILTIQEAREQFERHCRVKNLADETVNFYHTKLETFFKYLGDTDIPLQLITENTIEEYILYLKSKGSISDNTINLLLRAVRSFLYYYMKKGVLPSYSVTMIRADCPIKEPYTNDELKKLLTKPNLKTCAFVEYRNWVMVNFFIGTGCRVSTIINIRIQDIDLKERFVTFRHVKTRNQQMVPLSQNLVKVLDEYLEYRNDASCDYLFVNEYGESLSRAAVERAIRNYNLSRGVEKISIHLFRHTFAKMYIVAGGDPFRLQKLLGHSDLTMTKRYVALYGTDLKAQYDKLNPLEQIVYESHNESIKKTKIKL